jgi:prepilin-type N-terminal cleavage/methylation domain-containing protein
MKIQNKKYKIPNTKRGFTLVETLVSLFIFSLSITAIIVVTGQGVSDTTIAKNKITAVALAQEGIEVIRNIRDTYSLSEASPGSGWINFINDVQNNCAKPDGCFIEDIISYTDSPIVNPCNTVGGGSDFPSGCPVIERERLPSVTTSTIFGTLGFYQYNSSVATESPFQRSIFIECVNADCTEVRVESLVAWRQGTGVAEINAVENLFNWFKTAPAVTP